MIYEPPLIIGATWENYELLAQRPMTEYSIGKFMIMSDRKDRVRAYGVLFTHSEAPEQLRRVEEWHLVRELQKRYPAPEFDLPLGGGTVRFNHRANTIHLLYHSTCFGKLPASILEEALRINNFQIQDAGDETAGLGSLEVRLGDREAILQWYAQKGIAVDTSILR